MTKTVLVAVATAALLLLPGCAATMVHVEPRLGDGQDVIYSYGTPIVISRGNQSDVAIAPSAGATGRYKFEPRLHLLLSIRNRSERRIEVSEDSVRATGNGAPAQVVRAVELEDEIMHDAAWAQAVNAFAGGVAVLSASAGASGRTTYTGTVTDSAGSRSATFRGTSVDQGAAAQEARTIAARTAANSAAIQAGEEARLAQLARLIQRTTLEPGESMAGLIVLLPPRATACAVLRSPATPEEAAVYADGPCLISVSIQVGADTHTFNLAEVISRKVAPPAAAVPVEAHALSAPEE